MERHVTFDGYEISPQAFELTKKVEDSNAIALVPPEDPNALASAVMELLSNEEKANAMGRSGRMLVERLYSRRSIAQRVQDEARRLLNIGTDSTGFSV
jgi:glycosyltransferase involved in cell wall biosynthesis